MKHLTPYQLQKLDACSACGLCLPVCPTWAASREETDSPRGRVTLARSLSRGVLALADAASSFLSCTLCGKCEARCPANIPLSSIFFGIRAELSRRIPLTRLQSLWAPALAGNQKVVDFLHTPAALLNPLLQKWTAFPPLAQAPAPAHPRPEKVAADVLLFPGCLIRRFQPQIIELSFRLLEKLGLTALLLPELVCCGRPLAIQGKSLHRPLRKNFAILRNIEFGLLATPCPGCLAMLRDIIPNMADLPAEDREFAAELSGKCIDLATLVWQKSPTPSRLATPAAHIWWHRPCLKGENAQYAELQLLRLAGCEISSTSSLSDCCGAALDCIAPPSPPPQGAQPLNDAWHSQQKGSPPSERLPAQIRRQARAANVEAIITACPACLLKINRAATILDKLPVAYGIELWAALLLEEPFPWRSAASAASLRPAGV